MAGIRKPRAKVGQADPGVVPASLPDVADGTAELVVTEADLRATVIAWLDAHGYGREAETLRRDADRA